MGPLKEILGWLIDCGKHSDSRASRQLRFYDSMKANDTQ